MQPFTKHPHWTDVKKICERLHENGYVAWLAGGCVRDGILGIVPNDFDVATNATVAEIEKLFEKTIGVGKSFGVMRVVVPGSDVEVATFRKDGPYTDGRHPESVKEATPEEDAKRRDFTINGLFFDIFNNEVKDFVAGKKDIKARVIRTVGVAEERFTEDKLRILRAVRFVSQLDFNLEDKTQKAITRMAAQVTQVSSERIRDEIKKLLKGKRPDRGLKLLFETGLLSVILPETKYDPNWPIILKKMIGSPRQELMGWLLLFVGLPKKDRLEIASRLKLSQENIVTLTSVLENIEKFRVFKMLTLAEKKELSASRNTSLALDYLDQVEPVLPQVKKFVQANPVLPPPWIKSSHLIELGIKPGKEMGVLLARAYESQLSEKVKSDKEAIDWITNLVKRIQPKN